MKVMKSMARAKNASHVEMSKIIVSTSETIYLTIGKGESWSNETSPPQPEEIGLPPQEVLGYKKATRVALVRPTKTTGDESKKEIPYGNKPRVETDSANSVAVSAKWAYEDRHIVGDDLIEGTCRQVGFGMLLLAKDSISLDNLSLNEVESTVTLSIYDNKHAQNIGYQTTRKERPLIEV
ncbi:structural protein [Staphylococcus phage vB_SauH_DELF3]|nr:structural protein [Staphylococcus phage vB_SauH_DELF3]